MEEQVNVNDTACIKKLKFFFFTYYIKNAYYFNLLFLFKSNYMYQLIGFDFIRKAGNKSYLVALKVHV